MLTGKRFMTLAVVLGLCVLATAGCRRKSSKGTTVNNQTTSIFTTDSFPGEPVQAGNVADDQRALSEAGLDVDSQGDIRVFFNGDRDIAMVVYTTGFEGSTGQGTGAMIHYYDGVFRPGVPLTSAADLTSAGSNYFNFGFGTQNGLTTGDVSVAWINTDGNSSDLARARSGDAIIHWEGADQFDGGADGMNVCLFSTYFCADFANDENHVTAAGTEYRRGFDKFARRIDAEDGTDENVTMHGLLSDGLCGEARWARQDSRYTWGDETTQIVVFWNQFVNNTSTFDPTTLWARYPLDQATPEEDPIIATAPAEVAILLDGASDTGITSGETACDTNYISYNFTLFQRVAADVGGAVPDFNYANDDDDVYTVTNTFNSAGTDFFAPDTINFFFPFSATDASESHAEWTKETGSSYFVGGHSTYGPDEGILEIVQLHTEIVDEPTGSFGNATNSGELVLSQVDPATGADIGDAIISIEQPLITGDQVSDQNIDVRMGRNGDYLFVAWLGTKDSGGTADQALWVCEYRTSRDSDVPILAIGAAVTATVNVNVDIDGDPVHWFEFQSQLGYVCGMQSDAEVMNLFFGQDDFSFNEIDVVRLTADLTGTGAAFTAGPDSVVQSDDDTILGQDDFEAIDSGEGGNFFCAFDRDIDSAGIFTDIQVFAMRTGLGASVARIDSNLNFRGSDLDGLLATPHSDSIGVFGSDDDDSRSAPAAVIHVFFGEDEMSENNLNGTFTLRTRAFYTDDSTSFSDSFVPDLLEYPFQLALTQNDDSGFSDPSLIDATTSGNDVCLIFEQLGHLYYQHFMADGGGSDANVSWLTTESDSDGSNDDVYTAPQMVDDDSAVDIDFSDGWWTRGCVCDSCQGAMVFWMKGFVSSSSTVDGRYQVRVLASE
ncbi:MAG: hypothetical protein K8T20_13440 [Planctomycetes bacterium]|nr:hypothetical protein [Planctomycetota bacterium]